MATSFNLSELPPSIPKDPESVLDYSLDWATWLGTDTISSVVWNVPVGITQTSATVTATTATIWLSGGTAGQTYTIECKITTASVPARTDERSFQVRVSDR